MTKTETMSTKDIMELTGLSRYTVTECIKKYFPEKVHNGKLTKIDKNEAMIVVDSLRKTGFIAPAENMQVATEIMQVASQNKKVQSNNASDLQHLFADMLMSVKALADTVRLQSETYNQRISKIESIIENKVEERKLLLPVPQKSDRANLNEIIRQYSVNNHLQYNTVWGTLYHEAMARTSIDLKTRAKNKKMAIIDYADENGHVPMLLSLAVEMFGKNKIVKR